MRVLNPTHEPIDGIVLGATPHRNKARPYSPGSAWNQGGIIDSVELVLAPAVRIDDVFARGDRTSGKVRLETRVVNTTSSSKPCFFTYAIAPAQGVTSGALSGMVADPQGRPVAGARVVAVHEPSGSRYEAAARSDGRFTLRRVECLAACGGGPCLQVNEEKFHENLDEAAVDRLLESLP